MPTPPTRPTTPRRPLPRLLTAVLGTLVLLAAGCATPLAVENDSGGFTYTIGVLAPETGSHAEDGPIVRAGVELALADIKASGLLGKDDIRAVYADNQATSDVAVSAFNQLNSLDHPIASITTFSGPTLAIAPIATRSEVILLNPGGVTPTLDEASPYLFNLVPLMDTQAGIMLRYMAENRLAKRVALLYSNDALGQALEEQFAAEVKEAGLTYAGAVAFDPAVPDYRAAISKVQSMRPDVVYETGSASQSGNIIKQAASVGFTPRWLGYSAFGHQDTIEIGGEAAQGGLFTVPTTTDPATGEHFEEFEKFQVAYDRRTGDPVSDYLTQTSYESVQLVAAAIAAAKRDGVEVTGENVRREIHQLQDFASIFGSVEVKANGNLVQAQAVQEVAGDRFVNRRIYGPDEIADLG